MTALLCFCACPDPETALRIADALVESRVAACASVLPGMRSVYRWQGRVERADEALLLVKTSADAWPGLRDRLLALHPYELPELLAVEADACLPDYLRWVVDQTRPD